MKDLAKIQEFFSKPLNGESTTFKVGDKVTYLGYPAEITAVNKEMTGAITYNVYYNKGQGQTKASNINRDDIKPVNEAKSEDTVDTITMDIPLFLRMLEYSREDASQDMDLHDVTEKANLLGKERGILQMDDYDEIVGAAEKINETRFSKPTGSPYEQKDLYAQELFGTEYFNWLDFWEQFHIVQKYKLDKSIITKEGKEGPTTFKVGDIVSKKYASTDEDYTKEFKIIDITGMRATLQDIKTGKQTGIALSDLTERIINRLKNK